MRISSKLPLFSLFLFSLIGSSCFAANALPINLQSGWHAITQKELKKDVTYLSSDALAGRLSLSTGDKNAIDWIASSFASAGLKPLIGKSYLQPIKLIEFAADRSQSYVTLNGKQMLWKNPQVYFDFPNDIDISGDVAFVGYGITAPELHYDDYANVDVKGKVVLLFEHEPQEKNIKSIFNGSANTVYATPFVKALIAQQHGAIAVLVVPEPNRDHPSNQERRARISNFSTHFSTMKTQVLADDPLHIPVILLSDDVAKTIVGKKGLLSEWQTSIDRDLKSQSRLLPHTQIAIHNVNKSRRVAVSYNVVGLLEGSDPALKDETIIISAHHDHDGKTGKEIWHGADDNASGTVGVVSMAKALALNSQSEKGMKPKRSILFVVFAAEEKGLLGAFYMSRHPLRPLVSTRAMINFDMIGRNETASSQTKGLIEIPDDTTNRLNLIGSHYSPDLEKMIASENKRVGLTLDNRFDNEYALNIFFRSDQFPFVLQKIPAFWWFTGFHPDYHQVTDTADKINYAKMQKILRLAYLSTYHLVNDAGHPGFINAPSG